MNKIQTTKIAKSVRSLDELYEELRPLPSNAVMLGMANDGYPVLMDICSQEKHNTIIWDRHKGQGGLVAKTAIEYVSLCDTTVDFVVLSNRHEEWKKTNSLKYGGFVTAAPFWSAKGYMALDALAKWCSLPYSVVPVILFVDGIENIDKMEVVAQDNFKQILSLGKKKNIHIIASTVLEKEDVFWIQYFGSEIFGTEDFRWFKMGEDSEEILFFAPITQI